MAQGKGKRSTAMRQEMDDREQALQQLRRKRTEDS